MSDIALMFLIFSVVAASGLAIGRINIFGVRLGVAGVLFSGIFFGNFVQVDAHILEFVRDFGLILFVYTIGVQVGPSFFSSLKKDGLILNLFAVAIVLSGVVIAVLFYHFGNIPAPAAVGLLTGATTNTPSLGAAQQLLKEVRNGSSDWADMAGLGYAVAYPFGIIGIILTMALIKKMFKIDIHKEEIRHAHENQHKKSKLHVVDLKVENMLLNGVTLKDLPQLHRGGFTVSRVSHKGHVSVALATTIIHQGDVIRVVGPKEHFEDIQRLIGRPTEMEEHAQNTQGIEVGEVVVTKRNFEGLTIQQIQAQTTYGVNVTRIARAETQIPVTPRIVIHLADVLTVVGKKEDIERFAADLGNKPKDLDHPKLIPVFIGIALGVTLGSIPIAIPGIPSPIKLGLAGGSLLSAIVLGWLGRIGNVDWYMPAGANQMLRKFGIVMFLSCVGIKSGGKFIDTILQGQGLYWMMCAAVVTIVPMMIFGPIMYWKKKINYLTICGLLAGSSTNPPALAFANSLSPASAASIGYTSVYPLVMILRILSAQLLVILFAGH